MDKADARHVLRAVMDEYRAMDHAALSRLVGVLDARQVTAPGGRQYQIEIQVLWDHAAGGNIRVLGSVDDGGWSAFVPACADFILHLDGSLSDEAEA